MHLSSPDNYRPQTKLWEGSVFTPVCDSAHDGCVSQHAMGMWCVCPPPPWADAPTSWADTSPHKTATEAGGTHPTGMHSCLIVSF